MHQPEFFFKATLGRLARIITKITIVFFLCVDIAMLATMALPGPMGAKIVAILVAIGVPALILIFTYRQLPKGYSVTSSSIIVSRPGKDVVIPLGNLADIDAKDGKGVFSRTLRACASGGLFGFWGLFSKWNGSDFVSYSTRRDGQLVWINLHSGTPIVLSPDDPEGFVKAVRDASGGKLATG